MVTGSYRVLFKTLVVQIEECPTVFVVRKQVPVEFFYYAWYILCVQLEVLSARLLHVQHDECGRSYPDSLQVNC